MTDIHELVRKRDAARAALFGSGGHVRLCELREKRVEAKQAIERLELSVSQLEENGLPTGPTEEKLAALKDHLASLSEEFSELESELTADIEKAQKELHDARVRERLSRIDAASASFAASCDGLSLEELEARKRALRTQLETTNLELTAVATLIEQKQVEEEVRRQLAKLSPAHQKVAQKLLTQG